MSFKGKAAKPRPMNPKEWIPDHEAPDCMKCEAPFSCYSRRHHCRFCGFCLCSACSGYILSSQRACKDCLGKYTRSEHRTYALQGSPHLSKVNSLHPLVQPLPKEGEQTRKLADSPLVQHWRTSLSNMGAPSLGVLPGSLSPRAARAQPHRPPAASSRSKVKTVKGETDLKDESEGVGIDEGLPPLEAKGVVVVVDPFSTGALVVAECLGRGYEVLRVFSSDFPEHILNLTLDGVKLEYIATVEHQGDLEKTVGKIKQIISSQKKTLAGLIAGCETGVEVADAICEALECRGNGTELSDCRRNKYFMGERVRESSVRAVQQAKATTWVEIELFLKRFGTGPLKVVIKPVASAGSDNVYLCNSVDDVKKYFHKIIGATNMLGSTNTEVVVQEFLEGKEYVVDSVSRNGKHKVVTIWEYEKKKCNGANFVYFAMRLMSGEGKREQKLINYMKKVLDALGIVNGASHGEVMYTPTGPCLVEVGSRPHGGEGSWVPLVNKCLGRNQVACALDALLDEKAFESIPEYPVLKNFFGIEVFLVSQVDGKLVSFPRLEEVKKLKTFFQLDLLIKPGDKIKKTIDCISRPGSIRLCGPDKYDLEADYLRIRDMEKHKFYEVDKARQKD